MIKAQVIWVNLVLRSERGSKDKLTLVFVKFSPDIGFTWTLIYIQVNLSLEPFSDLILKLEFNAMK